MSPPDDIGTGEQQSVLVRTQASNHLTLSEGGDAAPVRDVDLSRVPDHVRWTHAAQVAF